LSALSFFVAFVYLILKLLNWDSFLFGIAPIMIGMFFMFGVLFIAIGLMGEYIGSIHTYVKNRPIVVEKERVNFD
jgi:dolichol-phosphate mannosyltransferase